MVLKKKLLLIFMRIGNILTLISPVFDLLKMKCEILIYIYVTQRIKMYVFKNTDDKVVYRNSFNFIQILVLQVGLIYDV